MCGICGYVGKKLISEKILTAMNDTMYHRGPNDSGIWEKQKEEYGVGFAQRRLSILDLSELGHQPMLSSDGKTVITYNGEVYNFIQLRNELEHLGHHFKSNCDTEVIIAAYRQWGCSCFAKLNGMFAIAIYDEEKDCIVLARDRMGKKPLYYYKKDSDFVFASELKPIMKYPSFSKEINYNVIGQYMCNKCIGSPDTIFLNTYKMKPGSYLIYHDGEIQTYQYWDLINIHKNAEISICSLDEAKKQLRELLRDSVSKRLIADVPVGTFLSGGIDSTLITAVAQEVSDCPVDSFTIGFYDKERNEAPYAAEIAKHIGTKHHEMYMKEEQILQMLQNLPVYYDEPFSDSSQLPSMLVSKIAAENVTVALSGDGGDELFCGYKMYDWTWIAQHFDFLGAIESKMPWNNAALAKLPMEFRAFIRNRDKEYKCQLYIDVMIEEAQKILMPDVKGVKFECEKDIKANNWQDKRMVLDMVTYLPDDILTKMDRASMKYSLEVRCPLLDYRIPEWSFQVSHDLKYHHFDKKYLLKELTYEYVPKDLLDRPKKGFGVPLRKWLRTVLKSEIVHFSEPKILKQQGIFDSDGIARLIEKQAKSDKIVYSSLLWSFYVFQKWYQTYIEDLW
ncbi:MAG: asparagine synthase (glutamine-hydrolyzing) [Lachnospiraceae bacterium]|nr:asparagine synthase (glutamine-hydrolyzing) [Lachnospiraceae bacterium]